MQTLFDVRPRRQRFIFTSKVLTLCPVMSLGKIQSIALHEGLE